MTLFSRWIIKVAGAWGSSAKNWQNVFFCRMEALLPGTFCWIKIINLSLSYLILKNGKTHYYIACANFYRNLPKTRNSGPLFETFFQLKTACFNLQPCDLCWSVQYFCREGLFMQQVVSSHLALEVW